VKNPREAEAKPQCLSSAGSGPKSLSVKGARGHDKASEGGQNSRKKKGGYQKRYGGEEMRRECIERPCESDRQGSGRRRVMVGLREPARKTELEKISGGGNRIVERGLVSNRAKNIQKEPIRAWLQEAAHGKRGAE